jgi:hypothetical protein
MPSIRYASLDEYWPAVRVRAFVKELGKAPTTYPKNMEILAAYAGVPVKHMPWVNPIAFAERLCSAAFSDPANLTKVMGKRAYFDMCYFHKNCSTNILPEPRPAQDGAAEARAAALAEMRALDSAANALLAEQRALQLSEPEEESEEEQEPEEEPVPPAVRIERAERKAEALERQFKACEAMWMSAMARAEEAEEQVRQLKKEVEQVHLADMIARDATAHANLAERNFVRLQKAISTVLYDADHVYHTKIYDEYQRTFI